MITTERRGAIRIVKTKDSLTEEYIEEIAAAIEKEIKIGRPLIVFDLSDVALINSRGLEILIDLEEQCAFRSGRLKVVAASGLCSDILRITGVVDMIESFATISDAVRSFVK